MKSDTRKYSVVTVGREHNNVIHVWDDLRARLLCRPAILAPIWGQYGSEITCKKCVKAAEKLEIVEFRPRSRKR